MVGGLADWFAVVALFRHPLGVPIPHTAIITERKAQFGETLGEFIHDSFLTPDAVAERVRAAGVGHPGRRLAGRSRQRRQAGRPRARRRRRGRRPPRGRRRPRRAGAPAPRAHRGGVHHPDGGPGPRRAHPGGPPRRGGRRRPAGPRPLPRRAPGRAPGPLPRPGAVVAARRGGGPHLRAPARRRCGPSSTTWPTTSGHGLRAAARRPHPAVRRRAADVPRAAGAGRAAHPRPPRAARAASRG